MSTGGGGGAGGAAGGAGVATCGGTGGSTEGGTGGGMEGGGGGTVSSLSCNIRGGGATAKVVAAALTLAASEGPRFGGGGGFEGPRFGVVPLGGGGTDGAFAEEGVGGGFEAVLPTGVAGGGSEKIRVVPGVPCTGFGSGGTSAVAGASGDGGAAGGAASGAAGGAAGAGTCGGTGGGIEGGMGGGMASAAGGLAASCESFLANKLPKKLATGLGGEEGFLLVAPAGGALVAEGEAGARAGLMPSKPLVKRRRREMPFIKLV